MKKIQAILFGDATLVDRRDVGRTAFNRVFEEAGLPWRWDAADYARLSRLSPGRDVLDAFIDAERPRWRNGDDLKHLLAAVRRRHAALCRSITSDLTDLDRDMAFVVSAARAHGVRMCAIVPSGEAFPEAFNDIGRAESYERALTALNVLATCCVAIEGTPEGLQSAADAGIAALDKLEISAGSGGASEAEIIALLDDVHANRKPAHRAPRHLATTLIA